MKLTIKKTTLILIGVIIGLLGLTAAAVASDIDWPWSSEPGFEPKALVDTSVGGNPLDESAELQPDDNGYTGLVIDINQADIPPRVAVRCQKKRTGLRLSQKMLRIRSTQMLTQTGLVSIITTCQALPCALVTVPLNGDLRVVVAAFTSIVEII